MIFYVHINAIDNEKKWKNTYKMHDACRKQKNDSMPNGAYGSVAEARMLKHVSKNNPMPVKNGTFDKSRVWTPANLTARPNVWVWWGSLRQDAKTGVVWESMVIWGSVGCSTNFTE